MKTIMVRYRTKPEHADVNVSLVRAVFEELQKLAPQGLCYASYRLADGVSFVHVVIEHDVENPDSLQAVPAFQAFVANIADRCDVPPVAMGATIVGGHN